MTHKTQKWRTSASLILATPTSSADEDYNVSCMRPSRLQQVDFNLYPIAAYA